MKYKIGQTVYLKKFEGLNVHEAPGINPKMEGYFGETVTIKHMSHDTFRIREDGQYWKWSYIWIATFSLPDKLFTIEI